MSNTSIVPPNVVLHGLARLQAGMDSDVFGGGCSEPWRSVGQHIQQVAPEDRAAALQLELAAQPGIDSDTLIQDVLAIDPTVDLPPSEESDENPTALPAATDFPIDALPESLAQYVSEGALAIGCPPDYIALPLLAAVSAAIGTTVRLEIKPQWYEWPSLFTAVVAPSGSKKTPAQQFALKCVTERSQHLDLEHQSNLQNYERLLADHRAAVDARRHRGSGTDAPRPPDKPIRPVRKRLMFNDATVEAIGRLLGQNNRGLLLVRDELSGLLLGLNQYRGGKGSDEQFFLSVWSGVRASIDRKQDDEPVILNQPFLSITGGIQPGIIPKILGRDHLHDGFTARFLISYPDLCPSVPSDAVVQRCTVDRLDKTLNTIYGIAHEQPYASPPIPHLVRLSVVARNLFKEWEADIGTRIDALSAEDPFRSPLSKMAGYLGRLALILHVVKWAESGKREFEQVSDQTMIEAIRLADYFVAHAERVWHLLLESVEDRKTRQVLHWIERRKRPVGVREILRSGVGGFRRSAEVEDVVQRLFDTGRIKETRIGRRACYQSAAKCRVLSGDTSDTHVTVPHADNPNCRVSGAKDEWNVSREGPSDES